MPDTTYTSYDNVPQAGGDYPAQTGPTPESDEVNNAKDAYKKSEGENAEKAETISSYLKESPKVRQST